MLTVLKLLHTAIWAFLAASILIIPLAALFRRYRWSSVLSGIVLLECAVLAFNHGRCPLTDIAARLTAERSPNFDIYLPSWLAQHNQAVFGTLFVAGEVVVLASWLRDRRFSSQSPVE